MGKESVMVIKLRGCWQLKRENTMSNQQHSRCLQDSSLEVPLVLRRQ